MYPDCRIIAFAKYSVLLLYLKGFGVKASYFCLEKLDEKGEASLSIDQLFL